MFRKLVSNLPFNPSLIGELSFYAQRVKRESSVRGAGLIVISLAIALQTFAVISPPEPSLARSESDMIVGGFSSRDDAKRNCTSNTRDYQTILSYYGIACSDIDQMSTVYIKSTDENKRLYTMGHLAYGKPGETPVHVPDAGTLYLRPLWSWDTNGPITFKALKGVSKTTGETFYLLFGCGNVTFIGIPEPYKEEPVDACPAISGIQQRNDECDLCPNMVGIQTTAQCDVCPELPGEQSDVSQCKPCAQSQTRDDLTACIEYAKTVSNDTQGITDANGTTAKAGDILTYTLTTSNKGKIDITDYTVNENVSDVLDYASIVDLHGGERNEDSIVSWPTQTIKAGESIVSTFTVRVKDPIPDTPVSSSDPGHFDLTMTNVYGNAVSVKLPPSVVKITEVVTTTQLPKTGPGTSLAVSFMATTVVAYLLARSRLTSRELHIIKQDFARTGGT